MANEIFVNKFNEAYPVGSKFRWRSAAYDSQPYETLTVEYPAHWAHGEQVVFAKERRGMLSIEPQFVDYTDQHS